MQFGEVIEMTKKLEQYELNQKFTEAYCNDNKLFGLTYDKGWFISGVILGVFVGVLGLVIDERTGITLSYVGFAVGAAADYFMRKEYEKELKKFKEGRSTWNTIIRNEDN